MNTKELAAVLNGVEYGSEVSKELETKAAENGLVIVFGGSDDLCEFRGAIHDEAYCYDGGDIRFDEKGIFNLEEDEVEVLEKYGFLEQLYSKTKSFEAVFDDDESEAVWVYEVPFPHETFEVREDGDLYCIGFVFDLKDVFPKKLSN